MLINDFNPFRSPKTLKLHRRMERHANEHYAEFEDRASVISPV